MKKQLGLAMFIPLVIVLFLGGVALGEQAKAAKAATAQSK